MPKSMTLSLGSQDKPNIKEDFIALKVYLFVELHMHHFNEFPCLFNVLKGDF